MPVPSGLRTRFVAFDTAVTDLTAYLHDPVEVLFGVQLGGGTDIANALGYCQQLIERPRHSVLFLVTDLFEGGNVDTMQRRVAEIVASGVHVVVLLALSDEGVPAHDHAQAAAPEMRVDPHHPRLEIYLLPCPPTKSPP